MPPDRPTRFTYESARYKSLMDEYATLTSNDEFAAWGKKAAHVAAYMSKTLATLNTVIRTDKARMHQQDPAMPEQDIAIASMQFINFQSILQEQLDDLVELMDKLPSGSARAVYEELTRPWAPKADTPYVRILVRASGTIMMDGISVDMDTMKHEFARLSQVRGLVLHTREAADGEPPPFAEQVIRLVIEHRLPIRLCDQQDFSDAIDERGALRVGQ